MQATLLYQHRLGAASARQACKRRPPTSRRLAVSVRAHDDDDILPIWSGRMPEAPNPESLPKSMPMGGKTVGEELQLIQAAFEQKDKETQEKMEKHLYSGNWQGDVYVGSNFNMLTLIMGLTIAIPVLGLLFAWLSYGTLWTGHYYGI